MLTLEERLLQAGLLSREELDRAVERSRELIRPLPTILVDEGFITEERLLPVLAEQYGLDLVSLTDLRIDETAVRSVPAKLTSHYGIVPIRLEAGLLTVAVANALDVSGAEDIESNLGYRVERVLAPRKEISQALRRYYGVGADTVERILADDPGRREQVALKEESHDLERMAEDASVIKLVNQLLQEAIKDRATDIHFEVNRDGVVARRRIDGILYDTSIPRNIRVLFPAIVSRIKLMSGLNIVERRLPQDGRARVRIGNEQFDLRISIVPALHGEDVVIRILPSSMLFDLTHLGYSEDHLVQLKEFIERPHGIIFVTGPTGSGKSTTLYACLSQLNQRHRKIITIEDPVEYELKGITQTQINPGIGLSFSRALRSMLRHDPDVMMVGEVRDRETAEIAIQTAMTGHLVLSTLHTNNSAGAAVRLIDMGIDPYLITSTVLVFIAQRLVRVLCEECREPYEAKGQRLFRPGGCRRCNHSGYRGRIAIAEFLPLAPEIQDLVLARSSAKDIRTEADRHDMRTLVLDGWEKVAKGMTTAEEVLRVTTL
jgi:type II secretory ATPase GspE/PulE/Tfp pilus assembly ATPase PilB-like protein